MGTYGGDFGRLCQAFVDFLQQLPFYGLAVLCVDDPVLREVALSLPRPVLTYGLDRPADLCAIAVEQVESRTRFRVLRPDGSVWLEPELSLPGRHNVSNALAAIAVAHELGVSDAAIERALQGFQGIGRRLQLYGEIPAAVGGVLLVDDYGHHPREIAASVHAIRAGWPQRRLVVTFQPHRYTRTRDLFEDFAQVLSAVDVLLLLEVYPAGERPIPGADGRTLCRAIRARGRVDPIFVTSPAELPAALAGVLAPGDVLLTLGAGDIGSLAPELAAGALVRAAGGGP
jgi:UDP-N-acetylmuramate--alanine ligase